MDEHASLVEHLRNDARMLQYFDKDISADLKEAANAIEELQQIADRYEETAHDYFKDVCYYLERMPKWIPVTERLPELGETVIVYTTESLVSVRRCYLDTMVISNTTDIPYWSVFQGRVLYWMRLPEPPKEE